MKYIKEQIDGSGNFQVKLRKNENSENLIKRFLKKTKKERLVEELLERKHYKKPTTKRREEFFKRKATLRKLLEKERLEMQVEDWHYLI